MPRALKPHDLELLREKESDFWRKVQRRGATDCWLWIGGQSGGYGTFYVGGGRENRVEVFAHRAALFFATGTWCRLAMHACDQPLCCNPGPGHLSWATHRENSQDALRKGRMYIGERNSNAVLNAAGVRTIRGLHRRGRTQIQIASAVGCTRENVSAVLRGKTWRHVAA